MHSGLLIALLASLAHTAPAPLPAVTEPANKFPFTRMVAFGDSLSDNGNGSYAHCVQSKIGSDCQNSIYGFRTWTDGPVAVSFLSDMLNVPLVEDYAFGWALGGSKLGASIEQSYTPTVYSQSGQQQIQNYTSSVGFKKHIAETLHFLWIGNVDINLLHLSTSSDSNPAFASQMAAMMVNLTGILIKQGAPYVLVPSLYAKELGQNWHFYASNQAQRDNMGSAIRQANAAIKAALLKAFPKKVIWYDAYSKMHDIWTNHTSYGINYVGDNFCDGHSQEDWDLCVTQHKGSQFYWMQYTDMTSHVHQILAQDMFSTVKAHFN